MSSDCDDENVCVFGEFTNSLIDACDAFSRVCENADEEFNFT